MSENSSSSSSSTTDVIEYIPKDTVFAKHFTPWIAEVLEKKKSILILLEQHALLNEEDSLRHIAIGRQLSILKQIVDSGISPLNIGFFSEQTNNDLRFVELYDSQPMKNRLISYYMNKELQKYNISNNPSSLTSNLRTIGVSITEDAIYLEEIKKISERYPVVIACMGLNHIVGFLSNIGKDKWFDSINLCILNVANKEVTQRSIIELRTTVVNPKKMFDDNAPPYFDPEAEMLGKAAEVANPTKAHNKALLEEYMNVNRIFHGWDIGSKVMIYGLKTPAGMELPSRIGKVLSNSKGPEIKQTINISGVVKDIPFINLVPEPTSNGGGFPIGFRVQIHGLTSERGKSFNDRLVTVKSESFGEDLRQIVDDNGTELTIKSVNLKYTPITASGPHQFSKLTCSTSTGAGNPINGFICISRGAHVAKIPSGFLDPSLYEIEENRKYLFTSSEIERYNTLFRAIDGDATQVITIRDIVVKRVEHANTRRIFFIVEPYVTEGATIFNVSPNDLLGITVNNTELEPPSGGSRNNRRRVHKSTRTKKSKKSKTSKRRSTHRKRT